MFTDVAPENLPGLLESNLQDVYSRKEIDDSIIYAKRIQDGMMLKEKHLKRIFPESFIYMRPRNIISGDFYWFTRIANKTIVAVADCTGHGIPGALMSILGISLLNQIIIEEKNTDPSFILQRLNHKVRKAFSYTAGLMEEYSAEQHDDGMDIALCSIDNETLMMQFAGAYRPLYHIHGSQLTELKGSKFPIGGNILEAGFNNQTLQLEKGDKIYLFSDGFASQFGYLIDKKFSSARVKDLLLDISENPFAIQQKSIEKVFMSWKLQKEQTDDVLAVGFKV